MGWLAAIAFSVFYSIYGDIGDYQPVSGNKSNAKKEKKPLKLGQYFQKSSADVS